MTGSDLFYNELHYNGLMTDLGLFPHRTIYSLIMQAKSGVKSSTLDALFVLSTSCCLLFSSYSDR